VLRIDLKIKQAVICKYMTSRFNAIKQVIEKDEKHQGAQYRALRNYTGCNSLGSRAFTNNLIMVK